MAEVGASQPVWFLRRRLLVVGGRWGRQYFAATAALHRADETGVLHLLDEPRGAVVADTQAPLHVGNGSLAGFGDNGDRLIVERIIFNIVTVAGAAFGVDAAAVQNFVDVLRLGNLFQVLDDLMYFVVVDKGAVHAIGEAGARRQIQHVAMAQQGFRALLVEDGTR